jgi:Arc/MetJ-type ribon-helix-helix transcriptional regulator
MNLPLRPDIQRFIGEQVKSGRFPTPESVVEAAVADMRDDQLNGLDDATIEAINEAEAQADLGQGQELDSFRHQMKRRMA